MRLRICRRLSRAVVTCCLIVVGLVGIVPPAASVGAINPNPAPHCVPPNGPPMCHLE